MAPKLDRLAIQVPDSAMVSQILEELGRLVRTEEAWPIKGWHVLHLTKQMKSIEDVQIFSSRLGGEIHVSPVWKGIDGGDIIAPRELLIVFRSGIGGGEQRKIIEDFGLEITEEYSALPSFYRVRSNAKNGIAVVDLAMSLASHPMVLAAEPDMVFTGSGMHIPNDPLFSIQWALRNVGGGAAFDFDMDVVEAWDRTTGASIIKVAVFESGIQTNHPDLNIVPGVDVTSQSPGSAGGPLVPGFERHGTAVAGCISARIGNLLEVAGIAGGSPVAPVRAFIGSNSSGSWTSQASWTVAGLNWAQANGVRVSNNSNSYGFESSVIEQAYISTYTSGMVHFASSGNDGANSIGYPARLSIVNAVGAVQQNGSIAAFSNYGSQQDFVAPGASVVTLDLTGSEGYSSGSSTVFAGTSAASPCAAAVAALILSVRPSLSPAQVEAIMRNSCLDIGPAGYDFVYGFGMPNARRCLEQITESPSNYCTGNPNSVGFGAFMSFSGSLSLAINQFTLSASGLPPSGNGVFYFGSAQTLSPFGNGNRCVGGVVRRLPVSQSNAFGDAYQSLNFLAMPGGQLQPGVSVYFQRWYRDAAAGGSGFNLSDGLSVIFYP